MKKQIKGEIGWGNNEYTERVLRPSNNNWFVLDVSIRDDIDKGTEDRIESDIRFIKAHNEMELVYVHKSNVDAVEFEYGFEMKQLIDVLDSAYGDWEQDYDSIAEYFEFPDHEAFEIVGSHIAEVLEKINMKMQKMSKEEIKEIGYKEMKNMEYVLFSKYMIDFAIRMRNVVKYNASILLSNK